MNKTLLIELQKIDLKSLSMTEKDYLQAVRSYNTTKSDAELLVEFRERMNKLTGK